MFNTRFGLAGYACLFAAIYGNYRYQLHKKKQNWEREKAEACAVAIANLKASKQAIASSK